MSEQFIENVLLRRITESDEAPAVIATSDDLGSSYEFRGIIQLKRLCNNLNETDIEDATNRVEYVFDITSVNKFQKQ